MLKGDGFQKLLLVKQLVFEHRKSFKKTRQNRKSAYINVPPAMATPDLSDTRRLTGPGDAPSLGAPGKVNKTVKHHFFLLTDCVRIRVQERRKLSVRTHVPFQTLRWLTI